MYRGSFETVIAVNEKKKLKQKGTRVSNFYLFYLKASFITSRDSLNFLFSLCFAREKGKEAKS